VTRAVLFLALTFAAVVASSPALAHDGHTHKVMGTVCAVDSNGLEVKATDGKTATLTLTESTKVVRGSTALKASDVRVGDRVVVTAADTKGKDGKTSHVAIRIQLGTASTAAGTCVPE
jgi:lipopolysaccharide export system protein LptA